MAIEPLLSKLQKVKPSAKGRWTACCPAHEDSDPSLAVHELQDGRILVHCFAGCSASEVVASVGLSLADLFPDGAINHQLRGWATLTRQERSRKFRDELIVEMGKSMRSQGIKLSRKDIEDERAAFLRLRNANHN